MIERFTLVVFFFFSSRRRHTRSDRDWSSDVCSSDLRPAARPQVDRPAHRWLAPRPPRVPEALIARGGAEIRPQVGALRLGAARRLEQAPEAAVHHVPRGPRRARPAEREAIDATPGPAGETPG